MQVRLSRLVRAAPWHKRLEFIVAEVPVPVPAVEYIVVEVTGHKQRGEMNAIKRQIEEVAVVKQRIDELAAIKTLQAEEMVAMEVWLDRMATMEKHHEVMYDV